MAFTNTRFTDSDIVNDVPDPAAGVITRTYAGIVVPANTRRRIRISDVPALQSDRKLQSDVMAGSIGITYPTMIGAGEYTSSTVYGASAANIIKSLGQAQGFQTLLFTRPGLISIPASGVPLTPSDPGGVWMKFGNTATNAAPAVLVLPPSSVRLSVRWTGAVPVSDSVEIDILIRADSTAPWSLVVTGSASGTVPVTISATVGQFFGVNPEIAIRIQSGLVTDLVISATVIGT